MVSTLGHIRELMEEPSHQLSLHAVAKEVSIATLDG